MSFLRNNMGPDSHEDVGSQLSRSKERRPIDRLTLLPEGCIRRFLAESGYLVLMLAVCSYHDISYAVSDGSFSGLLIS